MTSKDPRDRLILPPAAMSPLSRRRLLKLTGMGALGLAAGGGLLAACGDDDDDAAPAGGDTGGDTGGGGGDPVKAHWVYIGPAADNGWTQTHDQGRLFAQAALGAAAVTGFTENVGFGPETTQLFEQLVADGNQIIFANTEYVDLLSVVSDANPDVKFVECNGHHFTANSFGYYMAHEITAYLLGIAAGHLSPNGKLGYIGAFPSPTLFNDVNGMLLGARTVNPDATMNVVQINSFFDPPNAAIAAEALLGEGVDFLFGVMDEPTFLEIAEEAGVWTGYWNLDFRQAAPTQYVNNFNLDAWGPFYRDQLQSVVDGTWSPATEAVLLECPLGEWGPEVPQDVQDAVAEAAAAIAAGELSVYTGPLTSNKGAEVLAAGATLTSQEAYLINFVVDGVSGAEGEV